MSFWQTLKAKFSKKEELPPVPSMETINQQNADLTKQEQSVESLVNSSNVASQDTQNMPAPETTQPVAEPAPIVEQTATQTDAQTPVKKAAPKKSAKKAAPKKVVAKKAVKKAAPKKQSSKKKR